MKKRIWISLLAVLFMAVTAGGYAAYGMNKDKKAEKSVDEASASVAELYKEMQTRINEGKESGKFIKIDKEKILQAEALTIVARTDLEEASKDVIQKYGKKLAESISPRIEQVKEYNKGAEISLLLYERIDDAEKMAAENPLSPELIANLPLLKETVKRENERFKELKDPFSSLFLNKYVEKIERLEKIMTVFVTAEQAVQIVIDMSTDIRIEKADFDTKVEEAKKLIDELANDSVKEKLTSKLNNAVKSFGSMDTRRKEEKKKEEKIKEEEKKKAEALEAKNFTASDGTMFILSDGLGTNSDWKVAKKHGAALYYLPGSDVGLIVKNKKSILTLSSGSITTDISQASLLADLLSSRGFPITLKDVENVVKSGSPFENEAEYFRVYREGNKLYAETW
ncbi:hypothetical protein [Bacillus sp. EB01]|uniref:hypothetical protein n=1 Tax=Bacillus sp. EB01 TaxID=1347086 RepID=UPI0005C4AB29|nr:hypothetical protein [Bacillus sp. EB01]